MSNELIRIGKPPQAPAQKPWARRRQGLLFTSAGVFIGVAVAVVFVISGRLQDGAPASSLPDSAWSVSPTPTLKPLDVHGACVLLLPTLQSGADAVRDLAAAPDGSRVDWPELDKTVADLKTIAAVTPQDLRDDVGQQIATLSAFLDMRATGSNMTVDLMDFRASGLRLAARCAPYASR